MFSGKAETKKDQFLEQTKQARQERALERRREQAAICIQAHMRGYLLRQKLNRDIRSESDATFPEEFDPVTSRHLAIDVFKVLTKFLVVFDEERDQKRFQNVCRHIVASMDVENMKHCYVSITLMKQHTLRCIRQIKILLWQCCAYLQRLKPESPTDSKAIMLHLHTLVIFTSTNTWKILSSKSSKELNQADREYRWL